MKRIFWLFLGFPGFFDTWGGTYPKTASRCVVSAPTPPLVNILSDYLPTLPVALKYKGHVVVPKATLEVLKKGVLLRNKLAHAETDLKRETLREFLGTVLDLLYLLDYFSGHEWAFELITTTKALSELESLQEKS